MTSTVNSNTSIAPQVISPFPLPPKQALEYTREKVELNQVLPPPPVPNDFIVFGEEYHLDEEIIRPLSAQKIRKLYQSKHDWKSEMKKLNKSAIGAFLDLLDILIRCPEHPDRIEKLNDIHDIFINIHHLVNEFRPIQARDTLTLMQEKQLKDLEDCFNNFNRFLEQTERVLANSLAKTETELLPIPERRPDLEGPENEEEEEKEGESLEEKLYGSPRRQTRPRLFLPQKTERPPAEELLYEELAERFATL